MSFFTKTACGLLLAWGVVSPTSLSAQSKQADSSVPAPYMNKQERAGENLFLQNCSLCHLPRRRNNKDPNEAGTTIGPVLSDLFRREKPVPVEVVRTFILKGSEKMPGFQYGLEPNEIDNIIAYMKTL